MKTTLLILFLLPGSLLAQTFITIQGGSNFRSGPFSLEPNIDFTNLWKSSTTAIGAVDFILKRPFAISGSFEYDNYPFEGKPIWLVTIPEYQLKSYSGSTSRIYRFTIEGKLRPPTVGHLSLYLVSGVSYIIEHIGELSYIEGEPNGPDYHYSYPNQSSDYWAHTLGFGFQYSFSEQLGVDFTAKYFSNYSTHFHKLAALGLFYEL